jgi:hypothetical protein
MDRAPRIILEGFDNAGKTSIAKELSRCLNIPYFKNSAEKELFAGHKYNFKENLEYVGPYILGYWEQTLGGGIVLDRFTPSEFAYSRAYNRPTNETLIWDLDRRLSSLGFMFVFCYKTHYRSFEDNLVTLEKLQGVNDGFFEYYEKTAMNKMILDTTIENLESQISKIIGRLV